MLLARPVKQGLTFSHVLNLPAALDCPKTAFSAEGGLNRAYSFLLAADLEILKMFSFEI